MQLHTFIRSLRLAASPPLPLLDTPPAVPLPPDPTTPPASHELGLTLATQFGFMIESCILAARQSEDLVCPAHRDQPLSLRDLAPDVVSTHVLYYL